MTTGQTYHSRTRTFRLTASDEGKRSVHVTLALDGDRPIAMECKSGRAGAEVRGLYAIIGGMATLAMAHGAEISAVASVMRHTAFGPAGLTDDEELRIAKSLPDLIAAWLERFSAAENLKKENGSRGTGPATSPPRNETRGIGDTGLS